MRAWIAGLVVALVASGASATPRPLPFSYPYATLAETGLEVEAFVDLTPVRAFDSSGSLVWSPRAQLTLEVEYGLLDELELGLYFLASDDPGGGTGDASLRFDGIEQRLRWRLAESGEWPVDVSLYAELAELKDEIEIEAKINLERRFGSLNVVANLWAEREFYFSGRQEWVLHPTAGVSYQFSPRFTLGVEYWMNAEVGGPAETTDIGRFNAGAHHFVGPTIMVQMGKLWWSVAPYLRVDGLSDELVLGERFGHVFIRSVIGIEL